MERELRRSAGLGIKLREDEISRYMYEARNKIRVMLGNTGSMKT